MERGIDSTLPVRRVMTARTSRPRTRGPPIRSSDSVGLGVLAGAFVAYEIYSKTSKGFLKGMIGLVVAAVIGIIVAVIVFFIAEAAITAIISAYDGLMNSLPKLDITNLLRGGPKP